MIGELIERQTMSFRLAEASRERVREMVSNIQLTER